MTTGIQCLLWSWVATWAVTGVAADEKPADPKKESALVTVEAIAKDAAKSVVVITIPGRDGKQQGLGAGFVVSPDGLIATNLHVIGEARPIRVQFADGKEYDATEVHANDRKLDLAVIRIKAKDLPALKLGDASKVRAGQPVVALGNPLGLKHSVVTGVLSGKREIDGRQMLQLAIPIEPGNSGGPLLDGEGRVQGILTLKSAVTANLGFAVTINDLKSLLDKPNPIPIEKWLTIGALDPRDWTTLGGANWRQRASRIQVSGLGQGFGGRSLCLSSQVPPARPYEVAVTVKLEDEAGAAGLVFCSDGRDVHYGFYPSGGNLRLSRFEGPDVFHWKVLKDEHVAAYKPGEWNQLVVRVEKDKVVCLVNGQTAFELAEAKLADGKVGLAKFRDSKAEFKNFQVAQEIHKDGVPADKLAAVAKIVEHASATGLLTPAQIEQLIPEAGAAGDSLRKRADELERQAKNLRDAAAEVQERQTLNALVKSVPANQEADLFHAALLIAKLDNDDLDVESYQRLLDRMVKDLTATFPKEADERAKLTALNKFLFVDNGFHGSRTDYYNRSNSYLNEVLDDREGLPITLAVLYCELGRRAGMNIVGVPLPGHFMAQHRPAKGDPQLVDVFDGGKFLSREDAAKKVEDTSGIELTDEHLTPAPPRTIIVRMLHNLLNVARQTKDESGMLRYLNAILALSPEAIAERSMRVVLRAKAGHREGCLADIDWLLEKQPEAIDLEQLREFRRTIEGTGGKKLKIQMGNSRGFKLPELPIQ